MIKREHASFEFIKIKKDMKLISDIYLRDCGVLPCDTSLGNWFKMLPLSLARSLIGRLDLNSEAVKQRIVGSVL